MAIFNRQTMEQITQKMITWSKGVTSKLTDFRAGSKVRTTYEAVAIVMEDIYDRTFKAVKLAVLQNLYNVLGFTALPAINAVGSLRFYAQNAPNASAPYYIPMGTQAQTTPSGSTGPVTFQTTQDAYIYYNNPTETGSVTINGQSVTGWYYVDVPVFCLQAGTIGNVSANTIQTLAGQVQGASEVTNPSAITSGQEAETLSQQKTRFNLFLKSLRRGTPDSIQYAVSTAQVMDPTNTFIQERVLASAYTEGTGAFSVYLWNGVGTTQAPPTASTTDPSITTPATAPTLAAHTPNPASNFPAGTYFVGYTWEDPKGETQLSPTASVVLTAGQDINATVAAFPTGISHVNFYVGTSSTNTVWTESVPVTTGTSTTQEITGDTPYTCSRPLIRNAEQIVTGYTDSLGNRVWGYKPAGVTSTLLSVAVTTVNFGLTITPLAGYAVTDTDVNLGNTDLRPTINSAISAYFGTLRPGQTMVLSAVETAIKSVIGVYDVQITSPTANQTASGTTQLVFGTVTYTKGSTV